MTKTNQRPIAVDLFSGAGGMSLGFEQAGFDVVAAVEIDPIHAAAHKFNFPRCRTLARDVSRLNGDELRKLADLSGKKVDVVFGGAPCQGFSLIGQRVLDDPRNSLVRDFVRLVDELQADYFVFENVKGLTLGKHRRFLDELAEEFANRGYDVVTPWRVLNAACYGVPQSRERLFLLGARKGLQLPKYPKRLTKPHGSSEESILPTGPSCLDALGDLPDADDFATLWKSDAVRTVRWGAPSEYAATLRCDHDYSESHYGYERISDSTLLTSSLRTDHTPISRERFLGTEPGKVEPVSRFFKLPPNGLSNTLRAGTDSARGAFTSPRPIHYKYPRCITVREMARLHGFPDWFRLHTTKWHGARQVGNAVPPPLARAVASEVLHAAGFTPVRPEEKLELGDVQLLQLDMSEASTFWGIENPIAKRNKKNGQKKRKQEQIEMARVARSSSL